MILIMPERNGKWQYDPGTCMAIQVYVKDHLLKDEKVLFPYMMSPAVQIGKFQNAYEEADLGYMKEHGIKMLRRDTGGGAIYLDDKNMSFCFLFPGDNNIFGNYEKLYEPAIKALEKLGVKNLEQEGRNDLMLNGKKISGAAMTLENGRIYAGFSLLLDPDFETIVSVLNPNQKKIKSHGIQSIRSRVDSIRPHLASEYKDMTVWDFSNYMICEFLGVEKLKDARQYVLTEEDWEQIDKLVAEKYNNWDWTFGRFLQFEYELTERFSFGTVTVGMTVTHGRISNIQITGDFFGKRDISNIEEALLNVRLKEDELTQAVSAFALEEYFGGFTAEAFAAFLLDIRSEEHATT